MSSVKRLLQTPEKSRSESLPKKVSVSSVSETGAAGEAIGEQLGKPPAWFSVFLETFESRFSRLELRIETCIAKKLDEIGLKSKENEEKITACTIQVEELLKEVKKLREEKFEVMAKLDDLENRSRRNNLVLHGIPEKVKENCEETVKEFFEDFVGLSSSEYSIERCHRTPTRKPTVSSVSDEEMKPRIIHVALSTFAAKERVRKASIAKLKKSSYKEKKIFVSEDFSRHVLQQRREKMSKLKELKGEGRNPFFMYPAKLAYRDGTGKLHVVEE